MKALDHALCLCIARFPANTREKNFKVMLNFSFPGESYIYPDKKESKILCKATDIGTISLHK